MVYKNFDSRLEHNNSEMPVFLEGLMLISCPSGISSEKDQSNVFKKKGNSGIHFAQSAGSFHSSIFVFSPCVCGRFLLLTAGRGGVSLMTWLGCFHYFFLSSSCCQAIITPVLIGYMISNSAFSISYIWNNDIRDDKLKD